MSNMIGVSGRMSVGEFRPVGAEGSGSSGCWAKTPGLCVSGRGGRAPGRAEGWNFRAFLTPEAPACT